MSSTTIVIDVEGAEEISEFADFLSHKRGVEGVEIVKNGAFTQLKFSYDSNLFNLDQFGRLAQLHGVNVSDNLQFRVLPFDGLRSADDAFVIESVIDKMTGVMDSVVNFAAGLFFVAYDTNQTSLQAVTQAASKLGVHFLDHHDIDEALEQVHHEHGHADHEHDEHDHAGHHHDDGDEHEGEHHHHHSEAPAFLPEWAQHNWTWVQIGLAGLLWILGIIMSRAFPGVPLIGIVFYCGAYYFAGWEVMRHAIPALFRGHFDTDVLMMLAAIGAALLGAWAEGAFLLFLFALGHAGEDMALDKARDAINQLRRLMPELAYVKHGDSYDSTPVSQVLVGDVVLVKPGDRIPVDGVVLTGSSAVDQSAITGESMPVDKVVGSQVFAGTVNHTGSLQIRVTSAAENSTLAKVAELVEEAQSQRSKTQQWVARFTAKFVPAVLILTGIIMLVPWIFGWLPFSESFYRALTVLVAASPCALAIGTPAAVLSAIARAAQSGVLIKGGIYLEALGKLDAIAFDKTGTLTAGRFSVSDVRPIGVQEEDLLEIVGSVEALSNHPLAKAVVEHCIKLGIDLPTATNLENLPGLGVRGNLEGKEVLVGSLKMFQTLDNIRWNRILIEDTINAFEQEGKTVMLVGYYDSVIGIIALEDAPRPGTNKLIQELKLLGVKHVIMLTGDNPIVAEIVAKRLGIDEYHASLLPDQKLSLIRKLDDDFGGVAMIGDGVNDAPALAAPAVGIAMGDVGSGVALETADVVLMDGGLDKLPFVMGLAAQSQRIILQNLAIALGVILLLVISILFVRTPIGLTVFFHEGSTVVVALNALRLLAYKQRG